MSKTSSGSQTRVSTRVLESAYASQLHSDEWWDSTDIAEALGIPPLRMQMPMGVVLWLAVAERWNVLP